MQAGADTAAALIHSSEEKRLVCVHGCMQAYVHMCVHAHVCASACMLACMRVCTCACYNVRYLCLSLHHVHFSNFLAQVCLSVCLSCNLSVCLSGCLSVCLHVCLPVCLSLSVCHGLSAYMPICLRGCLPVCLSLCVCLPACLSVCSSFCLPLPLSALVFLSVVLCVWMVFLSYCDFVFRCSVCVSVCPSFCLSVCLSSVCTSRTARSSIQVCLFVWRYSPRLFQDGIAICISRQCSQSLCRLSVLRTEVCVETFAGVDTHKPCPSVSGHPA